MKQKALRKDLFMEIKKTRSRFLSIMLIAALGVAFFSGVRAASPDMNLSADAFYDKKNFMDIRVLGTLGLTAEDIEAISSINGAEKTVGGYSYDVLCNTPDAQVTVRLMTLYDGINEVTLQNGRMPEKEGECLADTKFLTNNGYQVGDVIQLTQDSKEEGDILDIVKRDSYEIVGSGYIPQYLSLDRGTSNIGNGQLDSFLLLPEEEFVSDIYTEICLTVDGAKELLYSAQDYEDIIEEVTDRLEAIADEQSELRYQTLKTDGETSLSDARATLEEKKQELADAQEKITEGEDALAKGEEELAQNENTLSDAKKEINASSKTIKDAKGQLEDGYAQLEDAKAQLAASVEQIEQGKAQLAAAEEELRTKRQELESGKAQLEAARAQLNEQEAKLTQGEAQIAQAQQQIEAAASQLEELDQAAAAGLLPVEEANAAREEYEGQKASFEQQKQQFMQEKEQALPQIEEARAKLAAEGRTLEEGESQLLEAEAYIESQRSEIAKGEEQIAEGQAQISQNQKTLDAKSRELSKGERELSKARKEYTSGTAKLQDAKAEIAGKEEELQDAKAEYEEAKTDADIKIADAQREIDEAQEELDALEMPEWYVLDRNSIQTYVEYGQDSKRIEAIGKVFPAIFFLVAALICLTTMTRMVEEERIQVGTLKALGYHSLAIAAKYIIYAFTASFLGSLIGLVVGQKLLPTVIIHAYGILYNNLPDVLSPLHLGYSISSTALAIFCTVAATGFACYKELLSHPAALMRPASPKAGKRVFLERLGFLWNHLNFTNKSTVRNLFRYKKRFFMTIFGIGGCMGLLLVGFGIKDSIRSIGTLQFGSIHIYNGAIILKEDTAEEEKQQLWDTIKEDKDIKAFLPVYETSLLVEEEGGSIDKSAYMIVPKETENLNQFIRLQNRITQTPYALDDSGVIITEKLAKLLHVEKGDTISLKKEETDHVNVRISHITENYFYHYVYISSGLYETLYGQTPDYLTAYTINTQTDDNFESQMRSRYMEKEQIMQVSFLTKNADHIANMLKSMDTIIYVLVISAGLLAFVVLYNLNNINISERKRELATLKVLGFYDMEVSAYVFRENVCLTLIGSLLGFAIGRLLHHFVILTAEVDIMMFGRDINSMSYLYSICLTFFFSLLVNLAMHAKLKKVDMVESMKSVE